MTDSAISSVKNANIKTLISKEQIAERITTLAQEIAANSPKDLLVVALLRGSFVFAADLLRALHETEMMPQVDFMTISSYGVGKESSGKLTVNRDIGEDVKGRHVLLIDDILESGRTLSYAREEMQKRGAASTHIAVFLEKPGKRAVEGIDADYVGFTVEDLFVVGYGLDYAHYYRELPFIGYIEN